MCSRGIGHGLASQGYRGLYNSKKLSAGEPTFFTYKMPKVTGWKVLIGELPTPFSTPQKSLIDLIKKHQNDGWVLKGEIMRVHPSSSVWTQRVVRYAKTE